MEDLVHCKSSIAGFEQLSSTIGNGAMQRLRQPNCCVKMKS